MIYHNIQERERKMPFQEMDDALSQLGALEHFWVREVIVE